ncbi:helix-turn-helix domain-containing protein [Bacillus sp. S13(2024)]|uniref:helix-turn-helix domain-containing protein n=1 Tax=unclassified Bacillus (in: firmicutes) TaxID=185979 RepID=UPI003D1E6286
MNYDVLNILLQYDDAESKVFMPNETFEDLKSAITNSPHIGFAYSYIYFITWQYRYVKHMGNDGLINNCKIKEILGYNPTTKGLDYLTKKNGLLDKLEYTKTVKDFPVSWEYKELEGLEFSMLSEHEELLGFWKLPRKYTIKFPVKAFYRHSNDEEMKNEYNEGYEDGTFYDVSNTHMIPFEVFMYCMSNKEVSCTGFYLYSYLKYKNDKYRAGYDVSLDKLADETGISRSTINRYLDSLKKFNLIRFIINQEFVIGLSEEYRRANTYSVNEYFAFEDLPQKYITRNVIDSKTYFKRLEESERIKQQVDERMDFLPANF